MDLVGLLLALVATSALAQAERPKVAILPLKAQGIQQVTVQILDDLLIAAVSGYDLYQIVGASDINAMLGLERMKESIGCNDIACAAEIGGALGVDHLLTGSVSKLGSSIHISLTLIDSGRQVVIGRATSKTKDNEDLYEKALVEAVAKLLKATPRGGLVLTVNPKEAECFVDGRPIGKSPCSASDLEPTEHTFRAELAGYMPQKGVIEVTEGSIAKKSITLNPLPVEVTIRSTPAGATLTRDSDTVGTTPYTGKWTPGTYLLEFDKLRFAYIERSVTLVPAKPFALSLELVPGLSASELSAQRRNVAYRWIATIMALTSAAVSGHQGYTAWQLRQGNAEVTAGTLVASKRQSEIKDAALRSDVSAGFSLFAGAVALYAWVWGE